MHNLNLDKWEHSHRFDITDTSREKRTGYVVLITLITMLVEITTGYIYGSMALLADGWHMGTHAAALSISVFAYIFARKYAEDARFTFGTGKVGVLGGYTSAILLAVAALMLSIESVWRLFSPVSIQFDQSISVAIVGLLVNIVCACILQWGHSHDSNFESSPHHNHHDHNLRAAYLHVIADALTSFLAIIALLAGKYFALNWLDPFMGIVGAVLIFRWSKILLKDSGGILLDAGVDQNVINEIKAVVEAEDDNRVSDIHVWQLGPKHQGIIISLITSDPKDPGYYKSMISNSYKTPCHLAVEVNYCQS